MPLLLIDAALAEHRTCNQQEHAHQQLVEAYQFGCRHVMLPYGSSTGRRTVRLLGQQLQNQRRSVGTAYRDAVQRRLILNPQNTQCQGLVHLKMSGLGQRSSSPRTSSSKGGFIFGQLWERIRTVRPGRNPSSTSGTRTVT